MIWEGRERRIRSKLKAGSASFISAVEDVIYKPKPMRFLVHLVEEIGFSSYSIILPFNKLLSVFILTKSDYFKSIKENFTH